MHRTHTSLLLLLLLQQQPDFRYTAAIYKVWTVEALLPALA